MMKVRIMKCYICEKGNLVKKRIDYRAYGIKLGDYPAEVCDKCGETFFDEETSKKINDTAKKHGLFGLEAKSKIGQAGSTLDIRLPKKIIEFMELEKGREITIMPEDKNRLVILIE